MSGDVIHKYLSSDSLLVVRTYSKYIHAMPRGLFRGAYHPSLRKGPRAIGFAWRGELSSPVVLMESVCSCSDDPTEVQDPVRVAEASGHAAAHLMSSSYGYFYCQPDPPYS